MIRQAISCDICGAEKKQTNHWFVAYEHAGELRVSGWSSRNRLRTNSKHLCGQTCLHKLVDEFMARTIAGKAATPATGHDELDELLPQSETFTPLAPSEPSAPAVHALRAEPAPTVRRPETRYPERVASVEHTAPAARVVAAKNIALIDDVPPAPHAAPIEHVARFEHTTSSDTSLLNHPSYDEHFESSARLIPSPAAAQPAPSPITAVVPLQSSSPVEPPRTVASRLLDQRAFFSTRRSRAEAWERERERELRSGERHSESPIRRHKNF